MRAIVVNGHAATHVEHAHGCSLFNEVTVDSNGLGSTLADRGDVGNLAALMIMKHFQARRLQLQQPQLSYRLLMLLKCVLLGYKLLKAKRASSVLLKLYQ